MKVIPVPHLKGKFLPLTDETQSAHGAGEQMCISKKTQLVTVSVWPAVVTTKFWIGQACETLLGMDVLLQLDSRLEFSEREIEWNLRRLQKAKLTEHPIWASGKNDCGLINMEPVRVAGTPPPYTRQYPINRAAMEGIKPII